MDVAAVESHHDLRDSFLNLWGHRCVHGLQPRDVRCLLGVLPCPFVSSGLRPFAFFPTASDASTSCCFIRGLSQSAR